MQNLTVEVDLDGLDEVALVDEFLSAVTRLLMPDWPFVEPAVPSSPFNIADRVLWPAPFQTRRAPQDKRVAWLVEPGGRWQYAIRSPLAFIQVGYEETSVIWNGRHMLLRSIRQGALWPGIRDAILWAREAHRQKTLSSQAILERPDQKKALEALSAMAAAAELAGRIGGGWGNAAYLVLLGDALATLSNWSEYAIARCDPCYRPSLRQMCPQTVELWPGAQWVGQNCDLCSNMLLLGESRILPRQNIIGVLMTDTNLSYPSLLLQAIRTTHEVAAAWKSFAQAI